MTREEIEKGVDELTGRCAETHDPEVKAKLEHLGYRLAELLPKTFSIESTCTAAGYLIQFKSLASPRPGRFFLSCSKAPPRRRHPTFGIGKGNSLHRSEAQEDPRELVDKTLDSRVSLLEGFHSPTVD